MAATIRIIFSLILLNGIFTQAYSQKFMFNETLKKQPDRLTTFCVPNNTQNRELLINEGISIKYSVSDWIFISATPNWVNEHNSNGELTDFYFEFAPPSLLSDTVRAWHYVNEVHNGTGGLGSPYTGEGVIIGIVDSGLDFNHPDFQDAQGNTRVLKYWDQTLPDNSQSPLPYGYGQVWDSSQINAGQCISMDGSAHGTTVAGQACGNGQANGQNKGMAPNAKIVIVESDFSRPNWTLTVADACDYVFSIADEMGLPAVVNLSLGNYLGSHDGNDPAAEAIEFMLDEKPGRIVVSAAGNSGNQMNYHVHSEASSDTNFTWLLTNNSGLLGSNTVFFDLWSNVSETNWSYSVSVDRPWYQNWTLGGETIYRGANDNLGVTVYDTIRNDNNDILCTAEFYTELVHGAYHMQMLLSDCDSSLSEPLYLYRFNTTGSGSFDLWSGTNLGLNEIVGTVMTPAQYPNVIYYLFADSMQSIVSSWNCSEKVVSVGNMRNRMNHIDANLNTYVPSNQNPPGSLSPNSSKGPNRHGLIKPDITAAGDLSLCAGPMWLLQNPANNSVIDSNGWHVRNGGTSMASPVVAGIAALYLERCGNATYQDFIDDLKSTAYTDLFTGSVPNNSYGYGKIHALNTLLEKTPASPPTITAGWTTLSSSSASGYQWFVDGAPINGETNQDLSIGPPYGDFTVQITDTNGCTAFSEPYIVGLSLEENEEEMIYAYPNPTNASISVQANEEIHSAYIISIDGSINGLVELDKNTYSLDSISSGTYILNIVTDKGIYRAKIVKL